VHAVVDAVAGGQALAALHDDPRALWTSSRRERFAALTLNKPVSSVGQVLITTR